MAITKQDYEARQAKVEAGTADDEDRRQISLYEADLAAGKEAPEKAEPVETPPAFSNTQDTDDKTTGRSRPSRGK